LSGDGGPKRLKRQRASMLSSWEAHGSWRARPTVDYLVRPDRQARRSGSCHSRFSAARTDGIRSSGAGVTL
jgi:hypothetical protein